MKAKEYNRKPAYWEKAKKFLSQNDFTLQKLILATPSNQYLTINKNPFETLVNAIIGQQISVSAANSILKKLENKISSINPKNIYNLHYMSLKSCGLSRQKIKYLKILSKEILTNPLFFSSIEKYSDQEVINTLTKLKGIGEWTAQMYLIFQLNREDIIPLLDIGFVNSFKRVYKIKDINSKKTQSIMKKWSPYSTVAVWYIWRIIDPDVVQY